MNGALLQHAAQEHAESAGAVLVVDDEKSVRTAIARLLRSMGVRVYTASCTDEALATLEAHADDVAVIVSDYAQPLAGHFTSDAHREGRPARGLPRGE
jgi:CheY-like chemotaxis protein